MASGYVKLFADIITSTIWQEPNDCRVLWITILALKDEDNICRATVPALARLCNISIEACETYLEKFQSPDKYSRSQDFEGRRIEQVDGGWFVLNGQKYRDALRGIERREYIRKKVAEHRERAAKSKQPVNNGKPGNQSKPIAEAEAEAEAVTPLPPVPGELGLVSEELPAPKPTDAAMGVIGKFFNRRSSTAWSKKEVAALQTICKMGLAGEAELELMRWYYVESGCQFLRRDVLTLLNNWTGELDRARASRVLGGVQPMGDATEALKNRIALHPANRDWVGYIEESVTEEQRAELAALKAQLAQAGKVIR